jgi:integrase
MTNRAGKGRPNAAAYVTSWGERIDGAYRGKDDKLRPTGRTRPAFSLTNERRAVMKIKRALQELSDEQSTAKHWRDVLAMPDAERQLWLSKGAMKRPSPAEDVGPAGDLLAAVRAERERIIDLILSNPQQAALELGIEHLAHYPATPHKPQFRLNELARFYCQHGRNKTTGLPFAKKWRDNVLLAWGPTRNPQPDSDKRKTPKRAHLSRNAFCDIVDVGYVRDVKQCHIIAYRDAVNAEFVSHHRSPSWLNARYKAVKAVISLVLSEAQEADKPELRRVRDLCEEKLKELPTEVNPSPIKPEHFRRLLEVAPLREKACLLLGLNCLMHSGEAAATLKEDIHWEDHTLRARRTKTRKPRIAVLWARTVEALQAYLQENENESEYLFLTRGGPMKGEYLRARIIELRRKAKLPEYVTFEGLRDAGYEYAEEIDSQRAAWIAGHGTGQKDNYVLRMPDKPRIRECCEAIERFFFGNE